MTILNSFKGAFYCGVTLRIIGHNLALSGSLALTVSICPLIH